MKRKKKKRGKGLEKGKRRRNRADQNMFAIIPEVEKTDV